MMARSFIGVITLALAFPAVSLAAEPNQTRLRWLQAKVERQQAQLDRLNREITQTPDQAALDALLDRILRKLGDFVRKDLPFHRHERLANFERLERQLRDEQLESAEKLRLLFKAYRDEVEMGQNLDAWDGELESQGGGQPRLVTFLRYGRLALVYQSFDGRETAWWDPAGGNWKMLFGKLAQEVSRGIRVAHKRVPPDLLIIPVAGAKP